MIKSNTKTSYHIYDNNQYIKMF